MGSGTIPASDLKLDGQVTLGEQLFLALGPKMAPGSRIELRMCYVGSNWDMLREISNLANKKVVAWDGTYFVIPTGNKYTAKPDEPIRFERGRPDAGGKKGFIGPKENILEYKLRKTVQPSD